MKNYIKLTGRAIHVLLLISFMLSGKSFGMDMLRSVGNHIYDNRTMYMTGGLILAAYSMIPTAEAAHVLELPGCPKCIPMNWNIDDGGVPELNAFYYQMGPNWSWGNMGSPRVEALGAFFNNTLHTGQAFVDLIIQQIRTCKFVCPDIPLMPHISKNSVDPDGYFQCVYDMQKYIVNGSDVAQPLFTRITQELFPIWHQGMYFQPSPDCH